MKLAARIARALRRPVGFLARRTVRELSEQVERFRGPRRARVFDEAALLAATGAPDLETLWRRLGTRPHPGHTTRVDPGAYERLCPGDAARIRAAAAEARCRRVRLLGSAPTALGHPIDWSRDFKSGLAWPRGYFPDLELVRRDDPSDVKVPWELSRLQWLVPAAQAHLLDGAEADAELVRDVLEEWIEANPYAATVNWGCAMEAALRILAWTFFFHALHASAAWRDRGFRGRFLRSLYLHGDFVERHLEWSDVNGNHLTADAAGLVFAGLFFGAGPAAERWQRLGWSLLVEELPRQVFADGVDFEASCAYHRLVLELFLLPALYRRSCGLPLPESYRERLAAMARFVAAYSRPDGTTPLWGDADDGRALPLGGQQLNDHRYLVGLVGTVLGVADLREAFDGPRSEVYWLLGPEAAGLPSGGRRPGSVALPEGGVYVMRNESDHVFIDCGPVGFAGRGGHGHNDCLSFEAVLAGTWLVSDCGAFTYSADFAGRNRFRSTASHNTPIVDGEEINRLPDPEDLWRLRDDARPEPRHFRTEQERDVFVGTHSGYRRLREPVTPVRTFVLDHARHALIVRDTFEGRGEHSLEIPLHLAPGVEAAVARRGLLRLTSGVAGFALTWAPAEAWRLEIGASRVSPSYGVAIDVQRLAWRREGPLGAALVICLLPGASAEGVLAWTQTVLEGVPGQSGVV